MSVHPKAPEEPPASWRQALYILILVACVTGVFCVLMFALLDIETRTIDAVRAIWADQ